MSKLAADAAAFKQSLHRTDYTSWHSQPPPLASAAPAKGGASSSKGGAKAKAPAKPDQPYSQPKDTGSGQNINTQLIYALQYLKEHYGPNRLQDIAISTSTALDTDQVLLEKFRNHEKVKWDQKTGLYEYKHDFAVRNREQLLTEIKRYTINKSAGISIRTLKDAWKEAPTHIEELEKEGKVYVLRTAKDGQMKTVFWNEMSEENEPDDAFDIEKEFRDMWAELKAPDEVDMIRQLVAAEMKPVSSEALPPPVAKGKKGQKKPRQRQRQAKITNTHLKGEIDLSRDYVPGQ
ncbi:transcription initiation factor IIE, beta subunit [Schizophyllum commune Loenen D]|nr:transcription initiation factor IIE, beta subunit [Schizophyllum commune Loenen D]